MNNGRSFYIILNKGCGGLCQSWMGLFLSAPFIETLGLLLVAKKSHSWLISRALWSLKYYKVWKLVLIWRLAGSFCVSDSRTLHPIHAICVSLDLNWWYVFNREQAHQDETEENFMIATATGTICTIWKTVPVGNEFLVNPAQIWWLMMGSPTVWDHFPVVLASFNWLSGSRRVKHPRLCRLGIDIEAIAHAFVSFSFLLCLCISSLREALLRSDQ